MKRFLLMIVMIALTPTNYCEQLQLSSDYFFEKTEDNTPDSIYSDFYRGQQEFSFAMLHAIQKDSPNENVFFSPHSTYHALLLAYFGANGETEKELGNVLRLQWAKKKHYVHAYKYEKNNRAIRAKNMPTFQFSSADKIFVDNSIKLTDYAKNVFFDELESKDFTSNAEQCRKDINRWIANITRNEIPKMLSPGDVSSETQLLLANAAYLKGKWAKQFDPTKTSFDPFYFHQNKIQYVSHIHMMHTRGTFNYAVDYRMSAHVLEMPYQTSEDDEKASEISMVIVLPEFTSLDDILNELTPQSLEMVLRKTESREVIVSMPKFEFEQSLELKPVLQKMGINLMFDHNADLSDFLTESKLMFGDVKHVSKIKVDEEGSTASSATVLTKSRFGRLDDPAQFICNHPFLFLIYDHKAKAILFTGTYRKPPIKFL